MIDDNDLLRRVLAALDGRIAQNKTTAAIHPDPRVRIRASARVQAYRNARSDVERAFAEWAAALVRPSPRPHELEPCLTESGKRHFETIAARIAECGDRWGDHAICVRPKGHPSTVLHGAPGPHGRWIEW